MKFFDISMASFFSQLLARREAELRKLIDPQSDTMLSSTSHEVFDTKDVASSLSQQEVEEFTKDHAAIELKQVTSAIQRIEDKSYGRCLKCGMPIDLNRLLAIPAASFCMTCQQILEQS
jgi:DnaK suppressor protein